MRTITTIFLLLIMTCAHAEPLGSSFTYQGELMSGGELANGDFDIRFELFDVDLDGDTIANTVTYEDVVVVDGIFTVELDFGPAAYSGDQLWLEIGVRAGDSVGDHTLLAPRQKITAAPYSLRAKSIVMNAVGSAEVDASQVQLRVSGDCAVGSSIRTISSDGTVTCENRYTDEEARNAVVQPTIIRTPDTRQGCPAPATAGKPLWSQSFELTKPGHVVIRADSTRYFNGRADLALYLDDVRVNQTLTYTSSRQWEEANVSWSGPLSAGTHTVDLRSPQADTWGCGETWGAIETTIYQ